MDRLQHPVPFNIPERVLETDRAHSDRFVYAPMLIPFDPFLGQDAALLPWHQLQRAAFLTTFATPGAVTGDILKRYRGLGDVVSGYSAQMVKRAARAAPTEPVPSAGPSRRAGKSKAAAAGSSDELKTSSYAAKIEPTLPELQKQLEDAVKRGDWFEVARLTAMIAMRAAEDLAATLDTGPMGRADATITVSGGSSGGTTETVAVPVTTVTVTTTTPPTQPPPGEAVPPPTESNPGIDVQSILASELAIQFLDRTRIRPCGFALGEHLYSLSLAPGEEIVLEEKTYSKREESFERSSELERTFDTEMSSTLTTELNEGMNAERSRTATGTNSMGVNVGGNLNGITFNVGPQWSNNVQDADRTTINDSVKTSRVGSSKVAARNRAQHKKVFKVTTESRFESTSRRTIQNPNSTTPIDLQYFKILQRLQLSHERYGVRLCWAPAVTDPGAALFARLELARKDIYARAAGAGAGLRPGQPSAPNGNNAGAQSVAAGQAANQFDPVWGGQRADYQVDIPAPTGLEWYPDRELVKNSLKFAFSGTRPGYAEVTDVLPTPTGVRVIVHVGVEDNANPFKPQYWEARGTASFTVEARFIPVAAATAAANEEYRRDMEAWRAAQAQWEATDAQAKADAKVDADEEWAERRAGILASANVMHESIGAIVSSAILGTRTLLSLKEIDFLEDVLDWDNAGLRLYPAWWSRHALRDPLSGPDSFLNASWARLYLPIAPGHERAALRWIYERVMPPDAASKEKEQLIDGIIQQLEGYRSANFGAIDELSTSDELDEGCARIGEKFVCLGRWDELLPTDGTHIEVMQSTSTAADDVTRDEQGNAAALRMGRIAGVEAENAIRKKAATDGLGDLHTHIDLNIGDDPSP